MTHDATKANILVVDDLPEKLLVLETILGELGENIVTTRSGEGALRCMLEKEFAVVLLDVNMPGMDGLETAAYIRRRKKTAHTPIIFITAFADDFHTSQGYSLGAVDYILSPIVPEVLRTKVKVFVDLFRMTQQVKQQAEEKVNLAKEQAARAASEAATRRFTFLAEASNVLARSLDFETIQKGLLHLVVPSLANFAAVTLFGESPRSWRTELAWAPFPDDAIQDKSLSNAKGLSRPLIAALTDVLASGQEQSLANLGSMVEEEDLRETAPALRPQSALILPIRARDRILGALSLAHDSNLSIATDTKSLLEDLVARAAVALDNARLYQDIQEADRRKNEFLAMLAHELRNPLAPIRNSVHILQLRGIKDPDVIRARDMIDRQVTHMARLVDDLLDMSRLSRGKILLRKESVDIVQLMRSTLEDYRVVVDAGNLEVVLNLTEEPIFVDGDPTRLAQSLGNVLHNACKFTDPGGKVFVTMSPTQDSGAVMIRIRDTGIGVELAMLERMFETFSQADGSLARSRGGLGLGLALVKGLVELHGGKVHAVSEGPGKGVEIVIQLAILKATFQPAAAYSVSQVGGGSLQILIIEDNLDTAESLRILLTLAGHQVTVALNGAAGVEAAKKTAPDAILCDIGLPGGMDGYQVARTLRKIPVLATKLFVATTGYARQEDQDLCHEAGFDAHLTKPVAFVELQNLLVGVQVGTNPS